MIFNPFWRGARTPQVKSFTPDETLSYNSESKILSAVAGQSPYGSGTSTGTNTGDQTITLTGDVTGSGTGSFSTDISASGVTAATYGDATHVPQIAIAADGRITSASDVVITGGIGGIGDVVGPASVVNNHVVFFDGTTGKLIKDSGLTLSGTNTGDSGTVTTVSVATANGVSGSVANPTTTPAITLTLGAITPTSVAASGTVTGSNLSGTNTGDQTLPTGANPTATAGDTVVNGSAATFMRSDGAPAIQLASASVFGLAKVDGTTITAAAGVFSASGGGGTTSGFGALTLITETVTSGSAASVTFSSIPATYRDLEIRVRGRSDRASNLTDPLAIQFNADTSTNYHQERFQAVTNITAAAQAVSQTSIQITELPAATATANYSGTMIIDVMDYRGTTFFKTVTFRQGSSLGSGATTQEAEFGSGQWISTAAINAVKVFPVNGNFVNGSVVSLYGRM